MARRKITKPAELKVAVDLPDITEQQMCFVQAILEGMSATNAYRKAYHCENMLPETVTGAASRLRNNSAITIWISQARIAGLGAGALTLDNHLAELERIRELALGAGNHGAAAQCEQLRGKARGHYTERLEITNTHDPLQELRELALISPTLAAQLAKDKGIPWEGETSH
jgi:hypothetical protein